MKEYWFYLEPDVFIIKKSHNAILYNSLSKEILSVFPSAKVLQLMDRLLDPNELYVTSISSKDLENKQIIRFIHDVRKSFFGDLIIQ